MSEQIERAIAAGEWLRARALIRSALKREPNSHWLITRLGLTYHEERQYKRSLQYSEKALRLAPSCPLVLWDYAGCLDMLGRSKEAMAAYRRIVRRGVARLANGDCGEGRAWAKALVSDCHYRMANCHKDLGDKKQAAAEYRRHFALRVPGCRSIYSIEEVMKEVKSLNQEIAQQSLQREGSRLPNRQLRLVMVGSGVVHSGHGKTIKS